MKLKINSIYFTIEEFFIIFIFILLLSPIARSYFDGYILCFFFIMFHECAHVFTAGIFGETLTKINIRLCGVNAVMKVKSPLHPKWIFIYFAGPLSNIILAILFWNIPIVRDINLALAIVNMIPIFPLDGFNICKILCGWFFSKKKANLILLIFEKCILIGMFIFAIIMVIKLKNISILIFLVYIICIKNYNLYR